MLCGPAARQHAPGGSRARSGRQFVVIATGAEPDAALVTFARLPPPVTIGAPRSGAGGPVETMTGRNLSC